MRDHVLCQQSIMIIIYAILFASAGLSTLAEASAIKGHAQPARALLEEGRSIKLAQASNNLDKAAKSAVPVTPVLESSKKVYNDESIRRLAQSPVFVEDVPAAAVAPVVAAPAVPVQKEPVVAAPTKVYHQEPVVQKVAEPAVVQQAPQVVGKHPESSVVVKEAPAVPVVVPQVVAKSAAAPAPEPPKPIETPAVVEPKSAPIEPKAVVVEPKAAPIQPKIVPVEPKVEVVAPVVKPVDDLPPQSERSAAVVAERPIVEQSAVAAAAPIVPPVAPVAEIIKESPLEAKKDEIAPVVPAVEPLHIEVPAPDPGLVLSEPIDSTTKLLIDLDEHVQKFLPAEDQQQQPAQPAKDQVLVPGVDYSPASTGAEQASGKSAPLVPYSGLDEPIVPPLPSLDGVEKASSAVSGSAAAAAAVAAANSSPSATRQGNNSPQNQQQVITQLLDQLDSLQNRIQDTINQLVARRRYVMSALLRPMGTYVRRVRTNLERLQTRVNQLQAAAVSVGGGNGPNRPGGLVDAAAITTIQRRIDDISKRISDIVTRIRFSLTPTSAPLNSNGRK